MFWREAEASLHIPERDIINPACDPMHNGKLIHTTRRTLPG